MSKNGFPSVSRVFKVVADHDGHVMLAWSDDEDALFDPEVAARLGRELIRVANEVEVSAFG